MYNRTLLYTDSPETMGGTVTVANVTKQANVSDIEVGSDNQRQEFATFEQFAFDFEKPIFSGTAYEQICFVSNELSDANGEFATAPTITIVPDRVYSGGGFSLETFYENYDLTITVVDEDGERPPRHFQKRDYPGEFYPFPYNNLAYVTFTFNVIPAFHFLKIHSVSLGGERLLTSRDFVDYPVEENHFTLNNEAIELNTLSFKIFGGRDNYNFIAGEKIEIQGDFLGEGIDTYFVDSVEYNPDGTIDVNCYDSLAALDDEFTGIMRFGTATNDLTVWNLLTDGMNVRTGQIDTMLENQTFSGTLALGETRREALRKFLLGNALSFRKKATWLNSFFPPDNEIVETEFTEAYIVAYPDVEYEDKKSRVHFSRHKYTVDKSNGKQEAYNDIVSTGSNERLEFGLPYERVEKSPSDPTQTVTVREYYHNGTRITGTDLRNFVVQSGAYFSVVNNPYSGQEIVVKDYPFKVNYTAIDYIQDTGSQFKPNEVMISDCTVCANLNTNADISAFKSYLGYIYSFRRIVRFSSLIEAYAGTYCTITFGGNTFEGWITMKRDNFNGIYDYEVICK